MTAPTTTRSAYPPPVEDLLPKAQELAERTGKIPSRNRLMKEFKVGAPKAQALREALEREASPDPVDSEPEPAETQTSPVEPAGSAAEKSAEPVTQAAPDGHPGTVVSASESRRVRSWPVLVLALPAFVAIWSGWVGLGGLTGFGVVHPLPGIADSVSLNTAITLPIGVETYAAYAIHVWLSGRVPDRARRFARWSAIGSLAFGAAGQIAYHLMTAAGMTSAPWQITTAVSCLPVAVLGMGAALAHLVRAEQVAR